MGSFWEKSKPNEETKCWDWKAARDTAGYGIHSIRNGDHTVNWRAHRLSYRLVNGPIPEGKVVYHKCDNPSCVNPNHLFLGTQEESFNDTKKEKS
jgi:hypothetical protein